MRTYIRLDYNRLLYELKLIDHGSLYPIPHILLFTLHYTVYSYKEFIRSVDTRFAILYRMNYTVFTLN